MIYSCFSISLIILFPSYVTHFELIIDSALCYHFIHIFSSVINYNILFLLTFHILNVTHLLWLFYHIPNLMSIHVHVIIVIFLVHVNMYSNDAFSLYDH